MTKMDPRCQRFFTVCTHPAPQGLLPETLMTSLNPPRQGSLRQVDVLSHLYYAGQKLLAEQDTSFTKQDLEKLDNLQKTLKQEIVIGNIKPETRAASQDLPFLMDRIVSALEQTSREKMARIEEVTVEYNNSITLFKYLIRNGRNAEVLDKFYPDLLPRKKGNVLDITTAAKRNQYLELIGSCEKRADLVLKMVGIPRNLDRLNSEKINLSNKTSFMDGFTKACRFTISQMSMALSDAPQDVPSTVVRVAFGGRRHGMRLG